MNNSLITTAAYVCVVVTVIVDRIIHPAALMLISYIDMTFAPASATAPVIVPLAVAVTEAAPVVATVSKPKTPRRRRSTATTKTAA